MYLGQIVEMGTRRQVFEDPRHAYTRRLLDAVPIPDPTRRRERANVAGEIGSSLRLGGAKVSRVALQDVGEGHLVAVT
jgi:peptide/nickel transport system ATP-binding protein